MQNPVADHRTLLTSLLASLSRPVASVATCGLLTMGALFDATPISAQQFGAFAVSHGGELLISEPVKPNEAASVYIYSKQGSEWVQSGTLAAPPHEGADYFGRSMAMDGRSLVVGGTTMDESTGAVWTYTRNGDAWESTGLLRPEDVAEGDSFGRFALLHEDLLFISGLGHNESRGAVWVFERQTDGSWSHEITLEPGPDAPAQEFFGWSLAYDGERLLTGAIQAGQELENRGAAYILRRVGPGNWEHEARLELDDGDKSPGDGFGSAVAWLDGQALIGVPGRGNGTGEVRTYKRERGEWTEGVTLSAHDRSSGSGFGNALVTAAREVWIGAPGAEGAGRVYQIGYDPDTRSFGSVTKLRGLEEDVGDGFGSFITVGDGIAVVGATGDDFGLGAAVVLAQSDGGWTTTQKLYGPDPTAMSPLADGEITCEDGSADQFACDQVDILSFLPVQDIGGGRGAETNDVWGWTDPQNGREYAIVGRTDGTAFIDITDPARPVYLGNLPKTEGSRGNSWRDVKVYDNHAYVVADGAGDHGMQVFDLTRLRNVTNAPTTFDVDAHYDGIASAHNIVINEATGYAYAVGANSGGETCGGGLHMIDINQPTQPTFIGCFSDTTTGQAGTGYSHDAMCIVYDGPDTEHQGKEVCFGSNENALSIADLSDKENPAQIASATYPSVAYAHQGWISEDHRFFFMNDEGDESASVQSGNPMEGTRTLVWDIEDLDDPLMVKEHFGETFTIDHNLYV
ncbi:MAG: choice-of-anchor B family protein, partial [Longimicrobiales bacterium]